MILADRSIWVGHLRVPNPSFQELLRSDLILIHPMVIGEVACGTLRERDQVLDYLGRLPASPVARHEEALKLVEQHKLWGRGIGWIDVHLLASALLGHCRLWALDHSLRDAARELKISYQ